MDLVIFWIFLVLEIRSFKSLRVAIPRAPLGTTKDLAKEKSEFMMMIASTRMSKAQK